MLVDSQKHGTGQTSEMPRRPNPRLISVIMPICNAEKYILGALRGLERQTYQAFELIIVDDHSSDRSDVIIRSIDSKLRITLLTLSGQRGVARARNLALKAAAGKYVWFVDVDDEYHPEFLAQMVKAAESSNADIAICRAVKSDSAGGHAQALRALNTPGIYRGDTAVAALLGDNGALWNKLFKSRLFDSHPFPTLRSKSDHAGIAAIAPNVNCVVILRDQMYRYIQRKGSLSNGGTVEPRNFLVALSLIDSGVGTRNTSRTLKRAVVCYRYDIYARIIRETWRFQTRREDNSPLLDQIRSMIRLRELRSLPLRELKTILTCLGAQVIPNTTAHAFRFLGRRLWVDADSGWPTG